MSAKTTSEQLAARIAARKEKARRPLGESAPSTTPAEQPEVPAQVKVPAQVEVPATKARASRPTATTARKAPEGFTRKCFYLPAEAWDEAKAAFLADWDHGGEASSIAAWVSAAAVAYARQTPQQRAHLTPEGGRAANGAPKGSAHTLLMDADALADMSTAQAADRKVLGRYDTESQWITGAIRAAVAATRERVGTLPPTPARLPARLTR